MTPHLAILIAGCSFAVGVIVGLIAGWRSRRGDDLDLRVGADAAPRGVRQ